MDDFILIQGSGALACFFAANLSAAGIKVKMLASWEEAVNAIRTNGVRVRIENRIERSFPVEIAACVDEIGQVRNALVLIKSWQTERAAFQLERCLSSDGIALSLQNGLGNREILIDHLGAERVANGVVVAGATVIEPGLIKAGNSKEVFLEQNDRLKYITRSFITAGFRIDTITDINSLLWGKLVVNAAINPLSALLGVNNRFLITSPDARAFLRKIVLEAFEVSRNLGVALPYANPVSHVEEVIAKTCDNYSSMLQDFKRCAPTEIEAINGQLIWYASKAGVKIPYNHAIYNLIKAKLQTLKICD